ncbi:hypothetical protein HYH03_006728 [Edaphochlamys debaryana]|uniref:Fungal lipase-type domain-containing protein n=1 Tax=Edaphochlamys debaryana TaxID=47281 RepID=A0A836C115_9CHLO|nr:hypothetical protein HYH03_006728 [Edaphochlamys debaryana]|eukprot:KAG2495118.1 hypothetical protein HYH03_006728 [Edaphochlamys debaryana]
MTARAEPAAEFPAADIPGRDAPSPLTPKATAFPGYSDMLARLGLHTTPPTPAPKESSVSVRETTHGEVLERARLISKVAFHAYGNPTVHIAAVDSPLHVVGSPFANDVGPYAPCGFINNARTDTQAFVHRNDRTKELVVAFRGTQPDLVNHPKDALNDLRALLVPLEEAIFGTVPHTQGEPHVHLGFQECYKSVVEDVRRAVADVLSRDPEGRWRVVLTGHSLGGALATLAAYDLANIYQNAAQDRVVCYTFASPRVCNDDFACSYNHLVPYTWRFSNVRDVVPMVPLVHWTYCHVGRNVRITPSAKGFKVDFMEHLEHGNVLRIFPALFLAAKATLYYGRHHLWKLGPLIAAEHGKNVYTKF